MSDVKNILLVGVGGQGTILASKILTSGLMEAGYDVKMSEIHGMSQRGGSVSTQVRYGKEVLSPIVGKGSADVIVAFERMEALRWLEYLKGGGKMVVNDFKINPAPVNLGKAEYPDDIMVYFLEEGKDVEACWVRLEGIQDGKMYGSVLTALRQDFGVKEKDTIYFGMTEMEDHKLACVWVKEDE